MGTLKHFRGNSVGPPSRRTAAPPLLPGSLNSLGTSTTTCWRATSRTNLRTRRCVAASMVMDSGTVLILDC